MSKVALIQFGYQHYAVPIEALSETLAKFAGLRRVSSRYEKDGYVYWYDSTDDREISVTVVPEGRVHAAEPPKAESESEK